MGNRQRSAGAVLLLGGLALGIGPLLPWLRVFSETAAGTGEMAGWVVIVAGWVVLSAGGNVLMSGRPASDGVSKLLRQLAIPVPLVAAWVGWLVGAGITVWKWIEIQGAINDVGVGTIGIGLWLQAAGLAVALVGFVMIGREYIEYTSPAKPTALGI
jgi:hypothetical protein